MHLLPYDLNEGHFQVSAPLKEEGPTGQEPINQIPSSGNWICLPSQDLFLLVYYLHPIYSPPTPPRLWTSLTKKIQHASVTQVPII